MRGHPVKNLCFVILAVITAACLVGYAVDMHNSNGGESDRAAHRLLAAREAYENQVTTAGWYNQLRPEPTFNAVARMIDNCAAQSFGGAVTVAVPDDELPLLVMEIRGWNEVRAKQALCAAAKLLARSGVLSDGQGIELRCEEIGRGMEGRQLTLLAKCDAAKQFALGHLSSTRFLRLCELARN